MDIFNDEVEVTVPEKPFEVLVGDGKKFADPDALAKAVFHATAHISKLESENAEFRTQLNSTKKIEDMFKELKANGQRDHTSDSEEAEVGNKEVDINKLVEDALAKRLGQSEFENNFKTANAALLEMYGDKAKTEVQKVADELGFTMDEMKTLAGQKPKAFLKYFQSSAPTAKDFGSTPPRGQQIPSTPASSTERLSFWKDLFKKDQKQWEKRAWERHQAAVKAGESFFDI